MGDPLAVANLALSLLGKTTEALNALRERSQRSKDIDIKDQINTLYDSILQLKEVMSRLLDENKELRHNLRTDNFQPGNQRSGRLVKQTTTTKAMKGHSASPATTLIRRRRDLLHYRLSK